MTGRSQEHELDPKHRPPADGAEGLPNQPVGPEPLTQHEAFYLPEWTSEPYDDPLTGKRVVYRQSGCLGWWEEVPQPVPGEDALATQGRLDGEFRDQKRAVIIVTTEDSWEHTIAPRLMAAGADRSLVYRAEVRTADDVMTGLSLPHDFPSLERVIRESGAALVILDPLLSRLDGDLDTHKDSDVRKALEPLVALANRTGVHVTGLIHVNKTQTTDPLTSLMASRAFVAVARAVLFVMKGPEEEGVRLVGLPKNNLGQTDLPTMRFEVEAVTVGADPDDGKPITAPRMKWLETTDRSVEDALGVVFRAEKHRSKTDEAGDWLIAYLRQCEDYKAPRADILVAVKGTEYHERMLTRAREKVGINAVNGDGFPRVTYWQLPTRLWPREDPSSEGMA